MKSQHPLQDNCGIVDYVLRSGVQSDFQPTANERMVTTENNTSWGRVDEDGTVYVREANSERAVGQYPDSTPEEALNYFTRKFDDLEGQVTLLEARIARDTAPGNVIESVTKLQTQLEAPAAVGDIASLRARVEKLQVKAREHSEQHRQERERAKAEALAEREQIVAEAEKLAAVPAEQIRWKGTGEAFQKLFEQWQASQRKGPQIPKAQADALWKQFRTARQSFDSARRQHFARMDQNNKEVKARKEKIIAAAEALAPKGADGIPSYRGLLEDWKAAGRANRKTDDQLWARFKAAGDVLYNAKAQDQAVVDEEYRENLVKKEALLDEAESLLKETEHKKARAKLTEYQLQWDEIGRVPRDSLRQVENRMRAIESHVKNLEDSHWRETDPETQARSEGLRGQLEASIEELEREIANASNESEKKAAQDKLTTQKSWLEALNN